MSARLCVGQQATTLVVARPRPLGVAFWRRPLVDRRCTKGGAFDLVVVAEAGPRPRFRPAAGTPRCAGVSRAWRC
ncbi:hypothetical protein DSL92_07235 [Billgrantia gudaonensis]|uniref:Uncharacterized protein n=1 Tax=Billgrantia gudaonensis TaxID=376427 RepID=A0A432JH69_9GAMM|nr:hypothetical protein DSL92_07235 [Halomonas gudaonensis]